MFGGAYGGVIKLWCYVVAVFVLGAWISPVVYNAGKALAEISSVKQTNGFLEWLAGICRAAEFPSFYTASVAGCAALLFLPLLEWLPTAVGNRAYGQPLVKNPWSCQQVLLGFLGMLGLVIVVAGVGRLLGTLTWRPSVGAAGWTLTRCLAFGLVWAVMQELWFRGVALGVFLRALPRWSAVGMAASYFAIVHFLMPQAGVTVADPDASGVGFELLGKILRQGFEAQGLVIYLLPWLVFGTVLALLRLRTASLCLPVGIHAGWVFGRILVAYFTSTAAGPLVQSLTSVGIISLVGLLACWAYPALGEEAR